MIIQCQSCASKYFLPEERVPVNPLKVRCPKCRAVFMLAGRRERVMVAAEVAAAVAAPAAVERETLRESRREAVSARENVFAASVETARAVDVAPVEVEMPVAEMPVVEMPVVEMPVVEMPVVETPVESAPVEEPAMETPVSEPAVVEAPVASAPLQEPVPAAPVPVATTSSTGPSRSSRGGKSADDRAKRLARVLVSDILWYNRERRDAALRDGTLMTSLGEEIKKSWELYKDKVGPEAAHSTNYFKEALNEILADGQQVF